MSSFSSAAAAADLHKRQTTRYTLPQVGIGCRHEVLFHDYYPVNHATGAHPAASNTIPDADWFAEDRVYIQSSLHADELPGLLVTQHLIKLLDIAASEGRIQKQITIVPYANPLGLNQFIHTYHQGRFSTLTGTNFNRDWMDISKAVVAKISQATKDGIISSSISKEKKVGIVRRFMYEEILAFEASKPEKIWKKELFKRSAISSIVLDLHCDSDATFHVYLHDRLFPEMADLTAAVESPVNLVSGESGGNPFDEANSCPWAVYQDNFPDLGIPMACHSATLELRGIYDVSDELAAKDASNLYGYLVRRGYIADPSVAPLTDLDAQTALPLTAVDMMEAPVAGVLSWKVRPGQKVEKGQLLGEVVNIDDVDAPRTPLIARTSGFIYSMTLDRLAIPGDIVIKVAGSDVLGWRKGYLLNA